MPIPKLSDLAIRKDAETIKPLEVLKSVGDLTLQPDQISCHFGRTISRNEILEKIDHQLQSPKLSLEQSAGVMILDLERRFFNSLRSLGSEHPSHPRSLYRSLLICGLSLVRTVLSGGICDGNGPDNRGDGTNSLHPSGPGLATDIYQPARPINDMGRDYSANQRTEKQQSHMLVPAQLSQPHFSIPYPTKEVASYLTHLVVSA
jgi:hypothetical protein